MVSRAELNTGSYSLYILKYVGLGLFNLVERWNEHQNESFDILNDVLNKTYKLFVISICDSFSWTELSVLSAHRCYGYLRTRLFLNFSTWTHYISGLYDIKCLQQQQWTQVHFSFTPSVLCISYSWFYNRGLDFCVQNSLYVIFSPLPSFLLFWAIMLVVESAVNKWYKHFEINMYPKCEPTLISVTFSTL